MYDLSQDSARLAREADMDWVLLQGSTVLVTGATGLVGSHCVRYLLELNRAFDAGISVLALVRDEARAADLLKGYGCNDGLSFVVSPNLALPDGTPDFDYCVHLACPTASAFFNAHPVETAQTIVNGTVGLLEEARRRGTCKGFLYVSSMEVYGQGNSEPGLVHKLTEADLGQVDTMSLRSCYPEGKRMAEQFCAAYAAEYGVPAKVIRLAQTFGPGIPCNDNRVFAQFARSAMEGRDIVLKTTGASTRMYLHTSDAVTAIFTVLLHGQAGCAYSAANEATYSSIYEMAQMVAQECGPAPVNVRVDVDPDAPYPPEHHLPLDTSRLRALGWQPTTDLRGMFSSLIAYLEGIGS